jgi:hypothetical protein
MHHLLRLLPFLPVLAACCAAPVSLRAADTMKAGDTVPAISARDQHEKEFTLGDDVERLLVAFDMGTGKAANGWLAKQGAAWLPERNAVFVSNIHGMPGIGRAFALPKMRKYPHRIILADAEGLLDPFPTEKDKVTVLELAPGRVIKSIRFWDPSEGKPPF